MNGDAKEESGMLGKKKQLIEQTPKRQKDKGILTWESALLMRIPLFIKCV